MNEIIYIKRFIALYWYFIGQVETMHKQAVSENHSLGIQITADKLRRLKRDLQLWQDKLNDEIKDKLTWLN